MIRHGGFGSFNIYQWPQSLAMDAAGNIFISPRKTEGFRGQARKFSTDGQIRNILAGKYVGFRNGPIAGALFYNPTILCC